MWIKTLELFKLEKISTLKYGAVVDDENIRWCENDIECNRKIPKRCL